MAGPDQIRPFADGVVVCQKEPEGFLIHGIYVFPHVIRAHVRSHKMKSFCLGAEMGKQSVRICRPDQLKQFPGRGV